MTANGDSKNGSDRPKRESSALEEVAERLSVVAEEEAHESPDTSPEPSEDQVHGWKTEETPTLEGLRKGLISVSKISEAAVEGGIKMSFELRKVVGPLQLAIDRIGIIVSKTEANAHTIDKVDRDFVDLAKDFHEMKKALQGTQVDVHFIKEHTAKIPALMEILGEILARLPAPEDKAPSVAPLAMVEPVKTGTE
jgi:hypothetical protein